MYDGVITQVQTFGCFVQLKNTKGRREGLVHISNIRSQRVNNPFEVVHRNQEVKVKVLKIIGTKISLSMKEVDQNTGTQIDVDKGRFQHFRRIKEDDFQQDQEQVEQQKQFGSITGVKLQDDVTKKKKQQKRISTPEL